MTTTPNRTAGVWLVCLLVGLFSSAAIFKYVRLLIIGSPVQIPAFVVTFNSIDLAANVLLLLSALLFFWLKKASFPLSILALALVVANTAILGGRLWIMFIFNPIFLGLNAATLALVIYSGVLFARRELS